MGQKNEVKGNLAYNPRRRKEYMKTRVPGYLQTSTRSYLWSSTQWLYSYLECETKELAEAILCANALVGCEPRNSKEESSAPNSRETQFCTEVALRESTRELLGLKKEFNIRMSETYHPRRTEASQRR